LRICADGQRKAEEGFREPNLDPSWIANR
jgi:hypothetical protein